MSDITIKFQLTVSESEGDHESGVVSEHDRLERVIEAEVAAAVDNDANTRDDKATVQAAHAVRLDRLRVHVNHAIELTLASLVHKK